MLTRLKNSGFILTVTPNPALDLSGKVEDLVPDEKNYVYDETRSPGGNGINVARILNSLKAPVIATGFLGGAAGQEIEDLLDKEKVPHQFIPIKGHTRTSITVSNKKTHTQTRLSFPGPRILSSEALLLHSRVFEPIHGRHRRLRILVIGGSLPPGYSVSKVNQLVRSANQLGIFTMVDIPGQFLGPVLGAKPSFIKPNLSEFQMMTQSRVKTRKEVIQEARKLLPSIPFICISSVEGGALLISKNGNWFGKGPRVKAKSSVGAGDSMVGGICSQLWRRGEKSIDSEGELLRWGLAAAMATVTTPGTHLGQYSEIMKFLPKIMIKQLD